MSDVKDVIRTGASKGINKPYFHINNYDNLF